jgi:integrase
MPLTEIAIRSAKAREKNYSLSDGDGLILMVKETGAKSWVLRYWLDGKEKRAGLGKYPTIGLLDARELKNSFKRELAHGGNPQERKRAQREEAARAKAVKSATFERLAEEWYSQQESSWSKSHCTDVRHKLRACLYPKLADRPIKEITTQEVLNILLDVESRTAETAYKSKIIVGQVFQFPIARGDADFDITQNLRKALKPKQKRHFAALTVPRDVADLMARMEAYSGSAVVKAALWFSLYTFQRPGEIRRAAWAEMDFDANLWRIPAERMKAGRPHVVPLSRQVRELLNQIVTWTGDSLFIFPTIKSKKIPMSENTILVALRSMGYTKEQMTAHGFRTLASTNLNEQGWNRDVIELSLAHVETNAVRAAYNHAERLGERREMMQAWANWLDGLREKA